MRVKSQAGSNLIEFALVLPLLLILVFGIVDFGIALYNKAVITNGSREAARRASVYLPDATLAAREAIVDEVEAEYAPRVIRFGEAAMPVFSIAEGSGFDSGQPVSATVTYEHSFAVISHLIPPLGTVNLGTTTTMRIE